jgi:hypothetical protein
MRQRAFSSNFSDQPQNPNQKQPSQTTPSGNISNKDSSNDVAAMKLKRTTILTGNHKPVIKPTNNNNIFGSVGAAR